MAISNFVYDLRELKFVLKEWLDLEKLLALPPYQEYYGVDEIDPILETTFKIARDVIGPIAKDTDQIGARFIDGKVVTPDSFKKAYATINEAGLGASNADREAEGRLPYTIIQANMEMMSAVNLSFIAFWGLTTGAISVIQQHGSDYLKQKFLPNMISGKWSGTMNLTEAGAGSDVGANITKAFPTDTPGIYLIKGNKQFITTGDNDLVENIIHLVLARAEGAKDGVAGLSLFIVPKYWVEDDGRLSRLNDVICTNIEEKMGVHGQPTCSLSYGENDKCLGYLIGDPPDADGKASGIAQMFTMMNEERLNVSLQGLGSSTEAYLKAREYAKLRVQGTRFTDPKGPKVRIIEHEDIRRMLMVQKATTEALRALILKSCYYLDLSHDSEDPEERNFAEGMFQISNPMCKAFATDMAWSLISDAIQIHGGYGFIKEYEVESLARDVKISSIWEGTNYIQALDLVGRKFTMSKGQVFKNWITDISTFIENNKGSVGFMQEFEIMNEALDDFLAIMQQIQKYGQEGRPQTMPIFATRILYAASILYCGRLILDQALLADSKLKTLGGNHFDAKFYTGKVASGCFYVKNVVPQIAFIRKVIQIGDTSAVDLDEECFG
ncbi:acyl-CoA dehydrogenase [Desulfosporosinus orientis DSM 765]|uniref:Acyl-CoA dehydrogenase n=1 Tax=Desulfosporosinus orientis (strain ATCC 19365 / DSM 765 / NCIMB 8382 / VKM B-1628 / Singapore I) TaxID=768706 RepID=G7WID9_DESOD|nr:acyl-CoA dehydrogenase [Desulfosporosinus orientis]AET68587.1 acyl-CoA dehydrogenase [Desulfosporosinus orientis DSM 765]